VSLVSQYVSDVDDYVDAGHRSLRPTTLSDMPGDIRYNAGGAIPGKEEHSISFYAEAFVTINRQPLSFAERPYLRWIYDWRKEYPIGSKNIVWVAGRQVEKTSTIAGKAVTLCITNPYFNVLAVEPRQDQTSLFSQQRFRPICEDSPIIYDGWVKSSDLWQVGARQFANGSIVNFKSCYYSADPARGVSARMIILDEVQDLISDNIPILEQSMSHVEVPDRFRLYTGTPKTTSNTLNRLWKETCQFEWLVPCEGCSKSVYLDDKVIGKKGYICPKCGKPINIKSGSWQPLNPSRLDDAWGFRMPQMMVPFVSHADILKKLEDPNIPRKVFFNEVLGLSYDEGELVLTEMDVLQNCEAGRPMAKEREIAQSVYFICAGIDHGTGGYSPTGLGETMNRRGHMPSFTVVAFGAFVDRIHFKIFKIIRFTGEMSNLAFQPEIINKVVRDHGAKWVMSDWGFGAHTNAQLVQKHGWTVLEVPGQPTLLEAEYVTSSSAVSFHDQAFRYMVDRNTAIERTVGSIKRGEISFFRQEEMKEFLSDFTSTFVEYNIRTNRVRYDHTLPDDAFHAVVYCYLAALQRAGRLVPTGVPPI